jgi:hypothetical protein
MGPILFVDDCYERADAFLTVFPDAIHVTTAQGAIDALAELGRHWIISLDHDLGPEEAGTGMVIVEWMVVKRPIIDIVIIHSWNVPASEQMLETLSEVGYRTYRNPFGLTGEYRKAAQERRYESILTGNSRRI